MNIAICDDDKEICRILGSKITKIAPGSDIDIYTSGRELIDAGFFPDILLLDIKMPETDGMETARILRNKGWKKILIFITGEGDHVFESFDVRAFHFLVKPFSDENRVYISMWYI